MQAFIQHMVDDSSQDTIENEEEESFGHEDEVHPRECKKRKCNQCFACCYQFLLKFRLNCLAFEILAKVYVFLGPNSELGFKSSFLLDLAVF